MTDATVPRSQPQQPISLTTEPRTGPVEPARLPVPLRPVVVWVAIVVPIALFLAYGTVQVGAGNWIGRRLGVGEIWSRFLGYLANQGAPSLLVLLVAAAAALSLVTAAVLLWLALSLRDQTRHTADDSSASE